MFQKQKTTKDKLKSLVKVCICTIVTCVYTFTGKYVSSCIYIYCYFQEIKEIEEFRQYTQKRQRDIVGRFVLFSVLIFIAAAIGFYFWALPEKTLDRVLYMIPFIFTPFL